MLKRLPGGAGLPQGEGSVTEGLGSQRASLEEAETEWSLLSTDRFFEVFCLTRKREKERDDRLVGGGGGGGSEGAFKTVASRWHTQHNKYPEMR